MLIQVPSAATIALPLPEHRPAGAVIYALAPASALTINGTPDGLPGQIYVFKVSAAAGNFVVTFGTNFLETATLATGVTATAFFTVTFVSDGQVYMEVARTAALA